MFARLKETAATQSKPLATICIVVSSTVCAVSCGGATFVAYDGSPRPKAEVAVLVRSGTQWHTRINTSSDHTNATRVTAEQFANSLWIESVDGRPLDGSVQEVHLLAGCHILMVRGDVALTWIQTEDGEGGPGYVAVLGRVRPEVPQALQQRSGGSQELRLTDLTMKKESQPCPTNVSNR